MKRNVLPNLRRVDWSDTQRQSEFVNSVVSALGFLGEDVSYDYACAASGSAFRTSFSMPDRQKWNFGNYYACYAPGTVINAFDALGYSASVRPFTDFAGDKNAVVESIDAGVPVVALSSIIQNADACIIAGYDDGGDTLLGYNPYAEIPDDHDQAPDETGYFRKTGWHEKSDRARLVLIGEKRTGIDGEKAFARTLAIVKTLIMSESVYDGQYNGLSAHKAFANALRAYEWDDNFEAYMCVMCTYKQYIDRKYAPEYLLNNGRRDLAEIYAEVASIASDMGRLIPQDFSAADMFSSKAALEPYCAMIDRIRILEEKAAGAM